MRAVKMVVSVGESPEKVAELLDINRRTIYTWLERFTTADLMRCVASSAPEPSPKLNAEQMGRLFTMIALSDPRQY